MAQLLTLQLQLHCFRHDLHGRKHLLRIWALASCVIDFMVLLLRQSFQSCKKGCLDKLAILLIRQNETLILTWASHNQRGKKKRTVYNRQSDSEPTVCVSFPCKVYANR